MLRQCQQHQRIQDYVSERREELEFRSSHEALAIRTRHFLVNLVLPRKIRGLGIMISP